MPLQFLAADEGNPYLRQRFPQLLECVVDGVRDFDAGREEPVKFPAVGGRDLNFTFRREAEGQPALVQGFTRPVGLCWELATARGSDIDFLATREGLSAWRAELEAEDSASNAKAIAAIDAVLPELA